MTTKNNVRVQLKDDAVHIKFLNNQTAANAVFHDDILALIKPYADENVIQLSESVRFNLSVMELLDCTQDDFNAIVKLLQSKFEVIGV